MSGNHAALNRNKGSTVWMRFFGPEHSAPAGQKLQKNFSIGRTLQRETGFEHIRKQETGDA